MTGRTVWFNCCAGVAGDMLLGALVDAGADADAIAAALAGLGVDGYALDVRAGPALRRRRDVGERDVVTDDSRDAVEASHSTLTVRPASARAARRRRPPRPRARPGAAVFQALAEAEGAVHGIDADDVELHEVGALDAIVDVVGVVRRARTPRHRPHRLPPDRGRPRHRAHGPRRAAQPAPGRRRAARPRRRPDRRRRHDDGAGDADRRRRAGRARRALRRVPADDRRGRRLRRRHGRPARPTQRRAGPSSATATAPSRRPRPGRPARLVEANVDDVTGEVLAHTIAALLAAGAHDAWATPIVMKKGRPGAHRRTRCATPPTLDAVAAVLLAETGSLGVRATAVERWPQRRERTRRRRRRPPGPRQGGGGRAKPEHDDAAAAAAALGLPLRDVLRHAETAAAEQPPSP